MMNEQPITILNVDDNDATRYARSRVLQRAGFAVREATNGATALQLVTEEAPTLVLLDVKLPDIDGFEVCRRIKANPATVATMVVQVSAAFVERNDKVRGLEGGADGYIVEPVHPDELVATVRAFVRLHQTEEKLQAANLALSRQAAELHRSNEDLQQFAYVASHDLQEPLRMVASYVQLLAVRYQGKLDAEADEIIGYAAEGAVRMQVLIRDLLDYSRVQTRGKPFVQTNCDELLARVLRSLRTTIEEKQAIVTHDPLPILSADRTQLEQVFQNLLSNALKFHGSDPPRIHVAARAQGPEWVFSVRDHGIGIDCQFAERIFVIFQRLHTRQEYPGTGIGLAICKKIIERHGGRIWVESEVGNGATFFFTLPGVRHGNAQRTTVHSLS